MTAIAKIISLASFPVKGLSPHPWRTVDLECGETFPFDRQYAVENGPSGFDPASPTHISKMRFIVLARFAELARLQSAFDPETHTLSLYENGKLVCSGDLTKNEGCKAIEAFFDETMRDQLSGPAKVLHAAGHSFSDLSSKRVHLVNAETVRAVGKEMGMDLDPLRFRANLIVEGLPAFAELEWADKKISCGDVNFRFHKRTKRCAAVDVNPATAERDTKITNHLYNTHGHMDLGIYLEVLSDGTLNVGDVIEAH
ncbi:MOSC domain-containing protein [Pseudovibrio flavus]|uniref:MOSC domain-containing protein n=1 Tax=Pseudovibrio flavus TaxID=2529854 RepID=UPI00211CAB6A|nr:MOSC domain-containing protein [Pseudovibrio flavus]